MDSINMERGLRYEKLLLRAFELRSPAPALGADCRLYYLLYYIRAGVDLRGTGYARQFVEIKEHVVAALQCMLQMELHRHEQLALQRLMEELLNVFDEDKLDNLITRALAASYRLEHMKDEELL
jgi:hypothetical protein